MSSLPPTTQRYHPFARIGRGGMAEVFLATTRGSSISKLVVLKRIWDDLAADREFVQMFLDEARVSVRMSHPNVVQTYEVVEESGRLTMAMEYLDGQPLTKILQRLSSGGDELTLAMRLQIIADILAGLDHAHALADYDGSPLGVVHRDVSPQNVFITYGGHVKLVDFGVAKTLAGAHNTRPGTVKGKLAYMAPEQLRGPQVDRRADIFSVGVMLWELLSRRRLFRGMTEANIAHHLSSGLPLPPLPVDAAVPADLEILCQRALAPNPDDRFSTAAEMETELRRALAAAADTHPRNLGNLVANGFASERAQRQMLIDRHLCHGDVQDISFGPSPQPPSSAMIRAPEPPTSVVLSPFHAPSPISRRPVVVDSRGLALAAAFAAATLAVGLVATSWVGRHRGSPTDSRTSISSGDISGGGGPVQVLSPTPRPVIAPLVSSSPRPGAIPPLAVPLPRSAEPVATDTTPDHRPSRFQRSVQFGRVWAMRQRRRNRSQSPNESTGFRSNQIPDPFARELGPPALLARYRQIDTVNPFTP